MDCENLFTSDSEEELEIIAAFVAIEEENKSSTSRAWVHEINEKRQTLGEFHRLVQELKKRSKTIPHVFSYENKRI